MNLPPKKPDAWNTTTPIEADVADVTVPRQGRGVLDDIADHLSRFVAFPSEHALVATALWVLHAHTVDAAESTPRLAFLSPEPGSGKSRALEVIATLVPTPLEAVNATPAALFRSVSGDERPTILFDEIDTVFGPKAKDNEELRGFLNAGHRRGALAYRCVGESQKVVAFPAYCAVALAGLHGLPETLSHRSVIIRMRRRGPGEEVQPFRARFHRPEGHELRDRAASWATDTRPRLTGWLPTFPDGVTDRPADVWEPLLSIAEVEGGEWPELAREACAALTAVDDAPQSLSVRLLDDLRSVFTDKGDPAFIPTQELLAALRSIEEAPWATYGKDGLTARALSSRLEGYGVKPHLDRPAPHSEPVRGYRRNELLDPWSRYLPSANNPLQPLQPPIHEGTSASDVADVAIPHQRRGVTP